MFSRILILALGGSLGTLSRYYLSEWAQSRLSTNMLCGVFPWGTLVVNVVGCLILGFILGFYESRAMGLQGMAMPLRLLLISGFLGALTTFSSYELEAFLMLRDNAWEKALLYLGGSIVLGLACIWLGARLMHILVRFYA